MTSKMRGGRAAVKDHGTGRGLAELEGGMISRELAVVIVSALGMTDLGSGV